jgi:CheY-like chemotaxis protein
MSHELRTPLNGIIAFNELIATTTKVTPQQQEYLSVCRTSAEALMGVVNNVLDFSKFEVSELVLEKTHFRICKLMDDLIDITSSRALKNNVTLVMKYDSFDTAVVTGDQFRLRQVLINLVDNSLKFSKPYSEVIITVKKMHTPLSSVNTSTDSEDEAFTLWSFTVEDTGIGIQKDKLHLLFQPFSQVNPLGTNYGGTGLGLTISKKIVNSMMGNISVTSEFGKGSKFTVEVPLASSSAVLPLETNQCKICYEKKVLILTPHLNLGDMLVTWFENAMAASSIRLITQPTAQVDWSVLCQEHDITVIDTHFLEECGDLLTVKMNKVIVFGTFNDHTVLDQLACIQAEFIMKPCKLSNFVNHTRVLMETQTQRRPSVPTSTLPEPREDFTVLVVDDNEIGQKVAVACLKRAHVQHEIASNGLQAYEKVINRKPRYDMILMDNLMPVMSGVECARRIRQWESENNTAATFIVGLSGTSSLEEKSECTQVMNEFFIKPVNPSALIKLVSQRVQLKKAK